MARIMLAFAAVFIMAVSGGAVCCAEEMEDKDKIRFGYSADKPGLTVYIKNYDENARYDLSINGGKDFIPMGRGSMHFSYLPSDTYQLCVMKNRDRSTATDIMAAEVDNSGRDKNEISLVCEGLRENTYHSGGLRITVEDYAPSKKYMLSYDGGRIWHDVKGRVTEITGLSCGYYTVCVKYPDGRGTSGNIAVYVPPKTLDGAAVVKAPLIRQLPELPTGCEITSLTMALNFYGFTISKTVLSDHFLEKAEYRTADFRKKFVGDPREIKAYGCYADVIVNSAEKFLSTVSGRSFDVVNLTGSEPNRLYAFLDMGYPVIVWATGKMMPVKEGPRWMDRETGNIVTWLGNEHCLLLTGYDLEKGYVYMNDPQYGIVSYKMELFEERFEDLEKQAIVIVETTKK